jgi:aminobenzoyl-glutamate utilization protein B
MMTYSQAMLRDSINAAARGGWSISEAILSTGQATADNLSARRVSQYDAACRRSRDGRNYQVSARLTHGGNTSPTVAGSNATGFAKSRPGLANHAMASMVWEQISMSAPVWCDAKRPDASGYRKTVA